MARFDMSEGEGARRRCCRKELRGVTRQDEPPPASNCCNPKGADRHHAHTIAAPTTKTVARATSLYLCSAKTAQHTF